MSIWAERKNKVLLAVDITNIQRPAPHLRSMSALQLLLSTPPLSHAKSHFGQALVPHCYRTFLSEILLQGCPMVDISMRALKFTPSQYWLCQSLPSRSNYIPNPSRSALLLHISPAQLLRRSRSHTHPSPHLTTDQFPPPCIVFFPPRQHVVFASLHNHASNASIPISLPAKFFTQSLATFRTGTIHSSTPARRCSCSS